MDFVGFGQSAPLKDAFSVGDYAVWTGEVLSRLGVERPHVIAHSFGCRVAVKMAGELQYPFDKILLTGPAGIIENRGFGYRLRVWAYRFVRAFAPAYAETHFGSAEYRTLSPVMKESYKKIVNEDLRECAERVRNSVLIAQGETDTVTPLSAAQTYLRSFPNARLSTLGGGHFAFAENPVAFNLIAEEFLYE